MKALYDTETQQIRPWPRADDGDVVGLEAHLLPLDVILLQQPLIAANQYLEPTIELDLNERTVTYGWNIQTRPAQWPDAQAFMAQFTDAEKAAIDLCQAPKVVALWITLQTWQAPIPAANPLVIGGLDLLVAAGIITEERKAEILASAAF